MASLFAKDKPYIPTWRPPVTVSPLIRLSRWAALGYGIYYGYKRSNDLREPARCQRDDFLARQCVIDAEAAEKKRLANEQEMIQLAKDAGICCK